MAMNKKKINKTMKFGGSVRNFDAKNLYSFCENQGNYQKLQVKWLLLNENKSFIKVILWILYYSFGYQYCWFHGYR